MRGKRSKLDRAVRLAAADLLEPAVRRPLERFDRRAGGAMTRMSRALLDDARLVVVRRIDPELEAGYYPRTDVIVLQPWLMKGSVDDVREAVLEESLHRCLCALGLESEKRHHRIIEPALRAATRL